MQYQALNQPVLSLIPGSAKRLLDLGCGTGSMGREIKRNIECEVVGVTYSEAEAASARVWLDQVVVSNLNEFEGQGLGAFDCIICSHILEHLYAPEELLLRLRERLAPDGVLIIALPNVLYWKQRLEFMRGRFRYSDGGLMDRTHYRFFDFETSLALVRGAGFEVLVKMADGHLPMPFLRSRLSTIASRCDRLASKLIPGLCAIQFIIVARK
jgi:SAM-dependent methyltransferase